MRWDDERYVRIYTRDTLTWKRLGWEGRALLPQLLRKVDRAGIVELGNIDPAEALAALLDMPLEVSRTGLERLLVTGVVTIRDDGSRTLVVPHFIEAQETSQTDAARKRKSREKARDLARASQCVTNSPEMGPDVTIGHAASQAVTPSCTEPSRTEPIQEAAASGATDTEPDAEENEKKRSADENSESQPAAIPQVGVTGSTSKSHRRPRRTEKEVRCRAVVADIFAATHRERTGGDFPWSAPARTHVARIATGCGNDPAIARAVLEAAKRDRWFNDKFTPAIISSQVAGLRQHVGKVSGSDPRPEYERKGYDSQAAMDEGRRVAAELAKREEQELDEHRRKQEAANAKGGAREAT